MVQNRHAGKQKPSLLGQDKQRKLPLKIMYAFCLSCPSATFALQPNGFVAREWLAAKGLLSLLRFMEFQIKLSWVIDNSLLLVRNFTWP